MGFWRAIRLVAFVAILAAWPVVIYFSRQRVWHGDALGLIVLFCIALGCPVFLIACAIALRSPVILGMTVGLWLGLLVGIDSVETVLFVICGVLFGFGVEVSRLPIRKRPQGAR
jgi:hypothetical protein